VEKESPCLSIKDNSNKAIVLCHKDDSKIQTLYHYLQNNLSDSKYTNTFLQTDSNSFFFRETPCNAKWNYIEHGDDWECDCQGKE
jgi:hypothetical protein